MKCQWCGEDVHFLHYVKFAQQVLEVCPKCIGILAQPKAAKN